MGWMKNECSAYFEELLPLTLLSMSANETKALSKTGAFLPGITNACWLSCCEILVQTRQLSFDHEVSHGQGRSTDLS